MVKENLVMVIHIPADNSYGSWGVYALGVSQPVFEDNDKEEVVDFGIDYAKERAPSQLLIQDRDGRIDEKNYGEDS